MKGKRRYFRSIDKFLFSTFRIDQFFALGLKLNKKETPWQLQRFMISLIK